MGAFSEVTGFFTTWNSIVCVRIIAIHAVPCTDRNALCRARSVSQIAPRHSGPYGIPYAVPSGGPRALLAPFPPAGPCARSKDPGLLRLFGASLKALHVRRRRHEKPLRSARSGGVQNSDRISLPLEGPSANSARVDARRVTPARDAQSICRSSVHSLLNFRCSRESLAQGTRLLRLVEFEVSSGVRAFFLRAARCLGFSRHHNIDTRRERPMDFRIPQEIKELLGKLDDFIEREIKPLENQRRQHPLLRSSPRACAHGLGQ